MNNNNKTNGSTVRHTSNKGKKAQEESKIGRASRFYDDKAEKLLSRHKAMWACHGGAGDMSKFARDELEIEKLNSMTSLEMLRYQMKEYQHSEVFSALAYQKTFVSFYHSKGSPTIEETKKGTLDRRPERVLIVRTCPSKMLIEEYIPPESRMINSDRHEDYWRTVEGDGTGGDDHLLNAKNYKSEEEKNIESLVRSGGLDPSIKIAFVYTVPYAPNQKWDKNTPPPEQAEHFCNYLKYAISAHARAPIIICMNTWCAKLVAAKCNADQVMHVDEIPSYGEIMPKINIYPLGVKNKNVRAMNRKLLRLPHSIMWENRTDAGEILAKFKEGVALIHSDLHIGKKKNANPFAVMMAGVKRKKNKNDNNNEQQESPKEWKKQEPLEIQPLILKNKQTTKRRKRIKETHAEKMKRILTKLNIQCPDDVFTGKSDPFDTSNMMVCGSIEPVNYGQKDWIIPGNYRRYDPSISHCQCPACGGRSDWCSVPTNEESFFEKEPEDFPDVPQSSLPCDFCCCKHGHRTSQSNGCVAIGRLGPRAIGCSGWRIPHIKADSPTLIKLLNSHIKIKHFKCAIYGVSIKNAEKLKEIIKEDSRQMAKMVHYGEWDIFTNVENDEYHVEDMEQTIKGETIDQCIIKLVPMRKGEIPSLTTLCVEKLRRMADPDTVMDKSEYVALHREVVSRMPRDFRDKYFRQCKHDVLGDNTIKYLAQGKCCARCSRPEFFKDVFKGANKSREINNTIKKWVDPNTMKMNVWIDTDPWGI